MESRFEIVAERRSLVPKALVRLGLNHPRAVISVWLLVALISAFGLMRLSIETSTDSVLNRSDSSWDFYQASLERFGGDEVVAILLESSEPHDAQLYERVVALSERLESIPGVWRVDSLATVPLVRLDKNGDLELDPVLSNWNLSTDSDLDRLVRLIRTDRIAPGTLATRDGTGVSVNVILSEATARDYKGVLDSIELAVANEHAAISGVPVFRHETDRWTRRELTLFVPLTAGVIGVLLLVLFRGTWIALLPIVTSGVGSFATLGLMGAVGAPLTISTIILPSILIALGCAYSMHFLTAYQSSVNREELAQKFLGLATAVTLSGLTTALGFLAIGFVRINAIRDTAIFGAFGVLVVLTASLTVVPAVLGSVPIREIDTGYRKWVAKKLAVRIVTLCTDYRSYVLAFWFFVLAFTVVGIVSLKIETDVILWFPKDSKIRQDYDRIRTALSGISPMNVVVEAPPGGSVAKPEVVRALHGLTTYLESLDSVGRAISIADPIAQIAQVLNPESTGRLPSSIAENEQYLLLLESHDYMASLISPDRLAANVYLRVNENGSATLLGVAELAEEWWSRNGVPGYTGTVTGIMYEFARSQTAISSGQIRGLLSAFVSIGLILVVVFRSLVLAAVTLFSNVVPIAIGFGAMGLLGLSIDAGTVVVGCIAFGIGVDDTIHAATEFATKSVEGASQRQVIIDSYVRVLPAIVTTTIVVSVGFLLLGLSSFALIRNLGLITAAVLVLCLLADTLLLPSLLSLGALRGFRGLAR